LECRKYQVPDLFGTFFVPYLIALSYSVSLPPDLITISFDIAETCYQPDLAALYR
jgi:hypothetical protein